MTEGKVNQSHDSENLSDSHSSESLDELWLAANPDLDALNDIIAAHFGVQCVSREVLGRGGYAFAYLVTLANDVRVVARVVLPVRDYVKTEAEVATMTSVRVRTSLPIPKVYLFCSSRHNPVRVEWIVMEYMPGVQMVECFPELSFESKARVAEDMAQIMATLYSITSSHCGCLLRDHDIPAENEPARFAADMTPLPEYRSVEDFNSSRRFLIGPVNEKGVLDAYLSPTLEPGVLPAAVCGPFTTELKYLQALAHRGDPPTRTDEETLAIYDCVLDLYRSLRTLHRPPSRPGEPTSDTSVFHLSHGDLNGHNLLVDPSTGRITGIIDWELAGFFPPWLAATAGEWFNDDYCRIIMEGIQESRYGFDNETQEDAQLRERFRTELEMRDPALLYHFQHGVDLRAIWNNLCNLYSGEVIIWTEEYLKQEWDVDEKGPIPVDFEAWWKYYSDLFEKSRAKGNKV